MQTFQNTRYFSANAYCGVTALDTIFEQLNQNAATQPSYHLLFLSSTAATSPTDTTKNAEALQQQLHAYLANFTDATQSTVLKPAAEFATRLKESSSMALQNGQRFQCGRACIDVFTTLSLEHLQQWVFAEPIINHWQLDASALALPQNVIWQMAAMSCDEASVSFDETINSGILGGSASSDTGVLIERLTAAGFRINHTSEAQIYPATDSIALAERAALRQQAVQQRLAFPVYQAETNVAQSDLAAQPIAIIGAGVAGSQLALSLARKGQATTLFCADNAAGKAASGNRQGALYPLLTPEASVQSDFFVQGYEYSRAQILQLAASAPELPFEFCGVVQTGFDERSRKRLDKIFNGQRWPTSILQQIDSATASKIAGIELQEQALYYPLGGWVCPQQLCQIAVQQAEATGLCEFITNCAIERIEQTSNGWLLISGEQQYGPFAKLVLANGAGVTQLSQTSQLPISSFRGQVSEINTTAELSQLNTVLCAKGYLTPAWQQQHCLGATYIKGDRSMELRQSEQQDNLDKMRLSYPDHHWVESIEIGSQARAGVRMVTRDHLPMVGAAPNVEAIFAKAEALGPTPESIDYWQSTQAPTIAGLYLLAGLGSRGICSGPLAAEVLACELLGLPMPVNQQVLEALNPNRMWLRKLTKGRAIS